jgi:hypothetical protein
LAFTSRRRFGVTLLASAAAVAFDLPRAVRAEPDVPFDASAYHHYRFPGPGLIAGSLAVQLQNNSVQTKAGAPVVALPDSPLTRAWLASSAKDIAAREPGPNEFDDPPIPDALQPFARGARAAEDGTFTFHRMPVGTNDRGSGCVVRARAAGSDDLRRERDGLAGLRLFVRVARLESGHRDGHANLQRHLSNRRTAEQI